MYNLKKLLYSKLFIHPSDHHYIAHTSGFHNFENQTFTFKRVIKQGPNWTHINTSIRVRCTFIEVDRSMDVEKCMG